MKVFITGSSGFLGRQIVECALSKGFEVVGLRRMAPALTEPKHLKLQWVIGDLKGIRSEHLIGIDCLVHAASAGVMKQEDLNLLLKTNFDESVSLLRTAVESGVSKFIIIGSWFEYGKSCSTYASIPAHAPLLPLCDYGISKAAFGLTALGLGRLHKLDMTLARVFHLYGEREPEHRFWQALRLAAHNGADFPMTKGEQIRDFVCVEDAANQIVQRLNSPGTEAIANKTLNIGTGNGSSLFDFASYWWKRWNAKGKILQGALPYRKNEIMRCIANMDVHIENFSSIAKD